MPQNSARVLARLLERADEDTLSYLQADLPEAVQAERRRRAVASGHGEALPR